MTLMTRHERPGPSVPAPSFVRAVLGDVVRCDGSRRRRRSSVGNIRFEFGGARRPALPPLPFFRGPSGGAIPRAFFASARPRLSMFGIYTVTLQQSFICVDPYLVRGDPPPLSFFCSAYHHAPAVREMRRGFACRPCARTSTRRRTKTQGITGWNSVRRGPLMAVTATARGRRPAGRRTGGV